MNVFFFSCIEQGVAESHGEKIEVVGSREGAQPRFFLFSFIKHAVLNGQTAHTKGCLENRCGVPQRESLCLDPSQIVHLAAIARTQPHAAFSAFTHALLGRLTFLARVTGDLVDHLQPLETEICRSFLPSLTGRPAPDEGVRSLLALPPRLGGLGIINPTTAFHSDSVDTLLYVRFAIQNLEFYEWKLGDHG